MKVLGRTILGCLAMIAASTEFASGETYPSRPVSVIVPFAAGGTVDIMGRIAAEALQDAFKESFVVSNRTGAGGVIGNTAVARSAPDGHTLLLAPTAFSIVPFIYKSLPYDPRRDFKPISLLGYTANVMVVSPSLNVKTVQEFITLAKSGAKPITYASPGVGTPQHLFVEYFASLTGVKMQHVPYAGSAPALVGIMAGDVSMMFADLAPAIPLIETGKLTALGVLTPERHRSLPDVPAVAETTPGFSGVGWQGLFAKAGTPDAVIETLNRALVAFLKTPAAADRMRAVGVDVTWSSPQETEAWVARQLDQFEKIVPAAGIKPE
jgi:tripartite-type tricarboxylate transporter receptor subunit TctC